MRPPDGPAEVGRDAQAGLTLVEVLVALVLFALIGAAGFSVLDQILRTQSRTEGRLERLAQVQRALHLFSLDVMQASGGSLAFAEDAVALQRDGGLAVRYGLEETALMRRVSGGLGQTPVAQVLLTDATDIAWRFYAPDLGWVADWPPVTDRPPGNPAAVELEVTLAGPGLAGSLRRVAILPAEARR